MTLIIIVADCVGHCVPGAFMSMIGNTLLKDTVSHKIQNPAQILTHLNDGIKTILRQKGKIDNIQNDGSMDITVCIYNPELKEIQIALANHRALLIRKDEINIIEGDIFAVGDIFTHMVPVKYTYKQYSIEKGDVLYMYTDGFQTSWVEITQIWQYQIIETLAIYKTFKTNYPNKMSL